MRNLKTTLLVGGAALCSASALAQEKLNVLYIMTDQQNYDMMSNMIGDRYIQTPAMDKMAAEGYTFVKTYCNNPVSMPSRYTLMTGRPASNVGVKGNSRNSVNAEQLAVNMPYTLGNLFKNAGYETIYSGKTHLYGSAKDYGFDIKTSDPYQKGCRAAVSYLDSRKTAPSGKPFFLFVSFMNPHDICYSAGLDPRYPDKLKPTMAAETKKYLAIKESLDPEVYKSQIPPRMPNEEFMITDKRDRDMPDPTMLKNSGRDYTTWTEEEQDTFRWMYCRLTESVDELIGKVIDALERTGEKENTILVFTSDHGELLGAHGYRTKSLPFEECQRVPFIFCGPGIPQGVKDTETLTCNGLDLLPTLCDFAGIEAPKDLMGVSLKPVLLGDKANYPKRKYIITEVSNAFSITDGENKLSLYEFQGLPCVFTNLKADPHEKVNMLKDKKYAKVIKEMRAELDKYIKDNNIKIKLRKPNAEPKNKHAIE